jgi:gamma-glutamyltranspeptidase/glutathione hydrolase
VLPETGLLMNNGITLFDPRPDAPSAIGPGKRLLTNMCPLILREGDRPMLAGGASRGRHIMAATFQRMTYIADFGMDPQAAAHAPRIDVAGPDGVTADIELGEAVIAALTADVPTAVVRRDMMPGNFANPNMILRHADGTDTGVADNRSPWSAAVAQQASA